MNEIVIAFGGLILIFAAIWLIPWVFMIQGTIYHQLIDKPRDEQSHFAETNSSSANE